MEYRILNEQMLHGGDYNPDQWLDRPDILAKDIELMKKAHVNAASVGIFAWAALEPEEGVYTFDWLEQVIDNLYENGIYTVLATPSGARPAWMAKAHPEVLRVRENLVRNQMGGRHNHCYTSPYYRQKVWDMNKKLSERFGKHPGVILWHISNEYSGACYCPLCQEEFRNWLKEKYGTLEALNKAWWTSFWSHTYTSWEQVEPPMPNGEMVQPLRLAWKRFCTDRTVDFCEWEIAAIRAGGSELPVTNNFMEMFEGLNYYKFRDVLDIASWDSYPDWHGPEGNTAAAIKTGLMHDLMRSIKKAPFLLMESVPAAVNWRSVCRVKRPGMHELSSLQAVAHGSNSVQYFQWRKSRGSAEKFHGAVVGHDGTSETRVFKEVARLGERLENFSKICKTNVKPEVAIIYDWENRWAIDVAAALLNGNMKYVETIREHYAAFWKMGIPVDVIDMSYDISEYKLVVAPMLYMQREGIEEKMRAFVEQGGTLVGTYWSGLVDENDLCFQSFAPHGLQDVFGLYSEEIDALYPEQHNTLLCGEKKYVLSDICDVVKLSTAQVLGTYGEDYYAGQPALTKNTFGKGTAYYLCARVEEIFYQEWYEKLAEELMLERALNTKLPEGVTAGLRKSDELEVVFLQNYNETAQVVEVTKPLTDMETGEQLIKIELAPYQMRVLMK